MQNKKHISLLLYSQVCRISTETNFEMNAHDLQTACAEEDLHSTQLKKMVCKTFFTLRLLTYGQRYYNEVLQENKAGKKQKLNRTAIFQNL